ncbi:MAG TPA: UDP-N-acetylglucosamine--N-acetylmuramyl-(pentapeptide) pyrophosphoryl-undecaprenol N-acetylglucosamine transferase [Patescibacteria group bacterium]|nr:UDP-N-acetylglucosamine--N-acetylmuramyl-(pentapeptide) pyrophosphoryl-undecaprenol N-acetylglucosamine transferase [Patescibacteria group bacterium]
MKIIIVGGHLSPALAVIDELPHKIEPVFIGRRYALEGQKVESLEYREILKRKIRFLPLTTARMQRKVTLHTVPSLAKMPLGFYQSLRYLKQEKPDAVLAFGGYLSVPVGFAARMLGIPLVIHEQTLEAGLANKMLAGIASKICISWDVSRNNFPLDKIVVTGNPLKKFSNASFAYPFSSSDSRLPLLYITGGSTGSHAINAVVKDCLPELLTEFRIIHQTGESKEYQDFSHLQEIVAQLDKALQKRYIMEKFIPPTQVGPIMHEASLVLSRAGMNTLTELIYFGKPSLLVPLMYGQRNEQRNNALFLQKIGLAEVLEQKDLTVANLVGALRKIQIHREDYTKHAKSARALLHPDAAKRIIQTVIYVVEKKSS